MTNRLVDRCYLLVFFVGLFAVAAVILIALSPWLFINWILDDAQVKE